MKMHETNRPKADNTDTAYVYTRKYIYVLGTTRNVMPFYHPIKIITS